MATLWITTFEHSFQTALGDPIQEQTVTTSGTSAQSSAISGSGKKKKTVRLYSDADCCVTWGVNPTATTSNIPMGADNPEYFSVEAGHIIAAITR